MSDALTAVQVAKRFGIHRNTVLYWIHAGYLPHARRRGPGPTSAYLVPLSDVEALERKLREPPQRPAS